jgi:patched 1
MRLALEHSLAPVLHGVITSTLAILMLSTSSFEFVVRHFFWLLLSVMSIGAVNGLFFFPILISLVGPSAEVIPFNNPNRISTPSPPSRRAQKCIKKAINTNRRTTKPLSPSRNSVNKNHHHSKHYINNNNNNNINNEPSLTTITEEPSWKSSVSSISSAGNNHHTPTTQSIVLQPEVNLEVETRNTGRDVQNTRVTATANIKLELINLPVRSTRTSTRNSESSSSGSNSS